MNKFYKFREFNTSSRDALANNSLWFARKEDFNDPFEGAWLFDDMLTDDDYSLMKLYFKINGRKEELCKHFSLKLDSVSEKYLLQEVLKEELNKIVDIIHGSIFLSLSLKDEKQDPIRDNLMWSHYAGGLSGFCLVFSDPELQNDIFESSGNKMRSIKIEYQKNPNKVSLSNFFRSYIQNNGSQLENIKVITQTMATKSKAWKYENEVRMIVLAEKPRLCSYSPSTLKEVVIGGKMSPQNRELLLSIIRDKYPHAKVKVAKLKPSTFKLTIDDL